MSYTINESREYAHSAEKTYHAACKAVTGLEGKFLDQDVESHTLSAKFHKTIHGKVLGDRTYLSINIDDNGDQCQLHAEIYPLDAVGRRLMFGARNGVSATVLNWFFAHVDHHLK